MGSTDDTAATDAFEEHRGHLHAVAYRMLGSLSEADDVVQETWLRFDRAGARDVDDLRAWLTTVATRICLDLLRRRSTRRETPLDVHLPDPIVSADDGTDPEHEAVLADSVGLAMLVVLDSLSPAERIAFVLHDVFAVPFVRIAAVLDRSPDATKQLASRARRRVHDARTPIGTDVARHRATVQAFLAASRNGDFDALLALLDPQVTLRADAGAGPLGPSQLVRGAQEVLSVASGYSRFASLARPVRVNGLAGLLVEANGAPLSLLSFVVADGRIVELDIIADPSRLTRLLTG